MKHGKWQGKGSRIKDPGEAWKHRFISFHPNDRKSDEKIYKFVKKNCIFLFVKI